MFRWAILGLAMLASSATLAQECLSAPISTTPEGPTWEREIERSGDRADLTVWRKLCSESEGYLVVTVEPTEGNIFLCSISFDVIQDSQQFSNFVLVQNPESPSSFCDDLLVKTTFVVFFSPGEPEWNTFDSFQLVFDSDQSLNVGAYDPSDYFDLGPQVTELQGALSGSWFDPSRSGEGFVLEFASSSAGPVATVYWFTHRDGQPYWLIGTEQWSPGDTSITIDLLEVSGADFGANFDPDDVQAESWGAISLEFDSCTTGIATWEHNGSLGSGSFDLDRLNAGLADGLNCE